MSIVNKTENLLYSFKDRIPNNGVDLGLYNIYKKESQNLRIKQSSIYYYYSILLISFFSILSIMSILLLLILGKINIGFKTTNIFYFVSLVLIFISLVYLLSFVSFVFSSKIQAKRRLKAKRIDIVTKFINIYAESEIEYLWYIKTSKNRNIHTLKIDNETTVFFSPKNSDFNFEIQTNKNLVTYKNKEIIQGIEEVFDKEFKLYINEKGNYNFNLKISKNKLKKTEITLWMHETFVILFTYCLILNSKLK